MYTGVHILLSLRDCNYIIGNQGGQECNCTLNLGRQAVDLPLKMLRFQVESVFLFFFYFLNKLIPPLNAPL